MDKALLIAKDILNKITALMAQYSITTKHILLVVVPAALLISYVSSGDDIPEENLGVGYYQQNLKEARKILAACRELDLEARALNEASIKRMNKVKHTCRSVRIAVNGVNSYID
ncbi:hypothetical protein A4G18_06640 [Pasteurellaceae bacterium Pebbles2]|nr:hypothetical protein [Pasteurellaceae bacterium Pebbles2]